MISDEDVRQSFQEKLRTPGVFGSFGSLEIYRGRPASRWKDAHPGGCERHLAVFDRHHIIPKYCFDCYKILIEPRTVMELFKLLMIFEKCALPYDNSRKCMCEARADCAGAYKGFIYTRGMEEGKEVRNIVREVISEGISPKVRITLKRGCSEYARVYPGYARIKLGAALMQYNDDWQVHEDSFDANAGFGAVDVSREQDGNQTAYSPEELFAMRYWLRYAATIGDASYLKIAGGTLPSLPRLKRPPFAAPRPI